MIRFVLSLFKVVWVIFFMIIECCSLIPILMLIVVESVWKDIKYPYPLYKRVRNKKVYFD